MTFDSHLALRRSDPRMRREELPVKQRSQKARVAVCLLFARMVGNRREALRAADSKRQSCAYFRIVSPPLVSGKTGKLETRQSISDELSDA